VTYKLNHIKVLLLILS